MSKFRKKPVVIDAWQLSRENGPALANWCDGVWCSLYGRGDRGEDISHIVIETLEGKMRADLGDWIVKGVMGECYPCKPDIFAATYEAVSDDGKTAGPPGSAEAPLGRSEHIPTPEGRGGGDAREAAKLLVSVAEVYAEYTTTFHREPSDKNRRKRDVAWQAYQDQSVVYGEQIARALLSSPRVEEVRRMREALTALRSLVREGGVPRYTVTPGAALNSVIEELVDPALSPPVG